MVDGRSWWLGLRSSNNTSNRRDKNADDDNIQDHSSTLERPEFFSVKCLEFRLRVGFWP